LTIYQVFLGSDLGVEGDHPPKMCAGLSLPIFRLP